MPEGRSETQLAGNQDPSRSADWSPAVSLDDLVAKLSKGYKTVGEMVYDVIKHAILNAAFEPGERLRQEALATAIGVSRIPVRSALMQLESEGLVVFHPRRGAVVQSLTAEQVREIYELREVLEVHALRKSLPALDDQRIAELRDLARQVDCEKDGSEFLNLRVAFYRCLYDADRNPRLVELIEELRGALGSYLLGWRKVSDLQHGGSHCDLVEHIIKGDAEAAEESLRDHLHRVRAPLEQMMRARESEQQGHDA